MSTNIPTMYIRFLTAAIASSLVLAPLADAVDVSHALAQRASKGGKASRHAGKPKQRKVKKSAEETATEPATAPADKAYAVFMQKLEEQVQKNIFDFCPPMQVALDATGDEFAAMEWMEKAAAAGNAAAMHYMADIELAYAPADELQSPRLKKAYQDIRKAADKGYDPAKCSVVLCLKNGIGVKKDEAAARKYMYAACKSGTFIPRLRWLLLEKRLESFEDRERAEVKAEIERGNYHVIYYLALMASNNKDRVEWLQKSAKLGCPEAYQALSVILSASGQYKESYDVLKTAASLHNPDALYELGSVLLESPNVPPALKELGVTQDNKIAIHFLRLATLLRQTEAAYQLGRSYYAGEYGVPCDKEKAYRHFSLAARFRHTPSQAAAGLMLVKGEGVAQDTKQGLRQLTLAANTRYRYAIVLLAYAHYKGLGVPADPGKAAEMLQEAAALGYPRAYVDLAYITAKGGAGEAPNEKMAQAYLRMATLDLKEKAQEYYDQLEKAGEWEPLP